MDKSVLDITVKMRNQKNGMTATEAKYIDGNFFVKLHGLNIEKKIIHNYL